MAKKEKGTKSDNYFVPPHGGRPPSDEAVKKATQKYIEDEKNEVQRNRLHD